MSTVKPVPHDDRVLIWRGLLLGPVHPPGGPPSASAVGLQAAGASRHIVANPRVAQWRGQHHGSIFVGAECRSLAVVGD
jgi:hypothetical protein